MGHFPSMFTTRFIARNRRILDNIFRLDFLPGRICHSDTRNGSRLHIGIRNVGSKETNTVSIKNGNFSRGDHLPTRLELLLLEANLSLETTIRCVGSLHNHSYL